MGIFEFDDYKLWVKSVLLQMPKGGRGQLGKIAQHLVTSPTIVTQVFGGERHLTAEQAVLLAEFFALSKNETRFLILLINYSRASSHRYRQLLRTEIEEAKLQAKEISSRVPQNFQLSEEAKAVLYSNWYYLAIWSLSAIDGFNDLDTIALRLHLDRMRTREAIDFLLKYSLILEDKSGKLRVGPSFVHIDSKSTQIARHHQNWRLQAFTKYEKPRPGDLTYTAAVTVSVKDAEKIRENMLNFISTNVNLIRESPSEELYCLCLDWFVA